MFVTWLTNYLVSTWLAGIVPYLVYILSTVVPSPVVTEAPYVQAAQYPTVYNTPVAAVQNYQSTQSNGGNGISQWLQNSNWPANTHTTVERIVVCESGGQTTATNGVHVGLLQVNYTLHGQVPNEAVAQLNQGYEVYKKQGWSAWSCY